MMPTSDGPTVFTVSELNQAARELLEHSFGLLWVEGEVSDLARPRSGHVYFSLKDGEAQVRCALFRNRARRLRIALDDGVQIRVRARVSLYATRGDFQLIIEHAEDAGAGALQRAFEALRARLDEEGLFVIERKRALPAVPQRIGVITSATGAAIRDVLAVTSRRYPLGALRIYPVPVQGEAAPGAITAMLDRISERADCDVLLLVRGGGSLEDLQAFNDEAVARAIVACRVPVVSGVGHEVDVTIADLSADMRAATPSAAAELVCPDLSARTTALRQARTQLNQLIQSRLAEARRDLTGLEQRLSRQRPSRRLESAAQRLDEGELRLQRQAITRIGAQRQQLNGLRERLLRATPRRRMQQDQVTIARLARQLERAAVRRVESTGRRVAAAAHGLHSVSPLQTVERGYAIARDAQGSLLRNAASVAVGERITVDLAQGRLDCEVRGHSQKPSLHARYSP
jgi:exodeoxyribonuclease VII large subunit